MRHKPTAEDNARVRNLMPKRHIETQEMRDARDDREEMARQKNRHIRSSSETIQRCSVCNGWATSRAGSGRKMNDRVCSCCGAPWMPAAPRVMPRPGERI